jgi:hypothetical protein
MSTPEEFRYLVSAFYQGSDREHSSQDEWILSRIGFLTAAQKKVVKRYLDQLLGETVDDVLLKEAWESGNSCYSFSGRELRAFLVRVRQLMAD